MLALPKQTISVPIKVQLVHSELSELQGGVGCRKWYRIDTNCSYLGDRYKG